MAERIEVTREETKTVDVEDSKKEEEPQKQEEEVEEKEEVLFQDPLPNRVIVARNHPKGYYVDRARRILRMEEELFVSGRGGSISLACTLVETLKRQKIGKVASISTGIITEPSFNKKGETEWSKPTTMITFKITRDELAEFVSDYRQRKVIEIFERKDSEKKGALSFEQIDSLKMSERFKANAEQIESAKAYMSKQNARSMDLPTFIKYASILIHPLLKDKVFKSVLPEFGVTAKATIEEDQIVEDQTEEVQAEEVEAADA